MAVRPVSVDAAITAVDRNCPRCGSPRHRGAEYCADCGLRLPDVDGAIPALRRRWLRRIGWYPGDWVWLGVLTFVVAAGGTAGAILLARDRSPSSTPTFVATQPPAPAVVTSRKPAGTPKAPLLVNGRVHWPADASGWTVVLGSFPSPRGRPAAIAAALHAARVGLHQVGTLDSSQWPSLNPGYDVVFSGIYRTAAEAEASLPRVRHAGFGGAYSRQIAR